MLALRWHSRRAESLDEWGGERRKEMNEFARAQRGETGGRCGSAWHFGELRSKRGNGKVGCGCGRRFGSADDVWLLLGCFVDAVHEGGRLLSGTS